MYLLLALDLVTLCSVDVVNAVVTAAVVDGAGAGGGGKAGKAYTTRHSSMTSRDIPRRRFTRYVAVKSRLVFRRGVEGGRAEDVSDGFRRGKEGREKNYPKKK